MKERKEENNSKIFNMNEDKVSALYRAANAEYTNMGDFEIFKTKLQNPEKRKILYDAMVADGYSNLGTYYEFNAKLGFSSLQEEKPYAVQESTRINQTHIPRMDMSTLPKVKTSDEVLKRDEQQVSYDEFKKDMGHSESSKGYAGENDESVEGFISGIKEGGKALKGGTEISAGEFAKLLTGSKEDASTALQILDEIEAQGMDVKKISLREIYAQKQKEKYDAEMEQYRKDMDAWYKKHPNILDRAKNMLPFIGDIPEEPKDPFLNAPNIADMGDMFDGRDYAPYKLLGKAIKTDDPKGFLIEKMKKKSLGDKIEEKGENILSEVRPTKGTEAWVGSMIPQMVPNAAAILLASNPYTRPLARPVGAVGMGVMTASSSGSAMYEARKYAEENKVDISESDILNAGVLAGGIELITEAVPFGRYLSGAGKLSKKLLERETVKAILDNPVARREANDFMQRAAKEIPGLSVISRKELMKYGGDVLAEGVSEFSAESLGAILPVLYANKEDYPTLVEILQNGAEGAKGGLFMGAFLEAGSSAVNNYAQNQRRKKQENIILADTENDGIVEILVENQNGYSVLKGNGEVVDIPKESVRESHVVAWDKIKEYNHNSQNELIAQKRQEAEQIITNYVNPEMNSVVTAVVGGYDEPVQVVNGSIVRDDYGFINREASDQTVVILEGDGKRVPVSIKYVEELEDITPVNEAMELAARIMTEPLVATQENEGVREYESGETVRVSPDKGNTFLMGRIAGRDGEGNYLMDTETPAGIQQVTVEPRQIINEDNMRGVDNGSVVEYRNNKGEIVQGVVNDAHGYRQAGQMIIDDEVVNVSDIIGPAASEIARQENASQLNPKYAALDDKALNQALSYISNAVERNENPEQTERYITERDGISAELERRKGLNLESSTAQDSSVLPESGIQNEVPVVAEESNVPETVEQEQIPGAVPRMEEITSRAPRQKNGDIDYDALLEQNPEDFAALYENEEGVEETHNELTSVSENLGKKIQAEQKKLENATSINQKKEAKKAIVELTGRKERIDGIIQIRYTEPATEEVQMEEKVVENVTDEKELDDKGVPFVKASNGTTVFGEVSDEQAKAMGTNVAAPIKLSEGNEDYGRAHIAERENQLKQNGYDSIEEFVEDVTRNYDEIRTGNLYTDSQGNEKETFLLVKKGEKGNVLYVELSSDGDFYNVNSGGIFKNSYVNKRGLLWNASTEHSTLSAVTQDFPTTQLNAESGAVSALSQSNPLPTDKNTIDNSNTNENETEFVSNEPEGQEENETGEVSEESNLAGMQGENAIGERLSETGGDIIRFAKNETKRNEIAEAEQQVDVGPSEAQKEAGNYRKGHVKIHGFDISIEQPKGSVRSGVDENGKAWQSEMKNTYGYIRETEGRDRDHIDVFVGDNPSNEKVFVVDQVNPNTGEFDEHKVMMGFNSIDEAEAAYLSNYEEGWQGLGNITETSIEDFRKWAETEGRRIKPFSEYKSVQGNNIRLQAESTQGSEDLEAVNERFNQELENFKVGALKPHEVLHLGKPMKILNAAGIKDGEMSVTQTVLKGHLKQHGLTTEDLKGLAGAIQKPVMIYEWGTKAKSTVIITELTTKDGRKITVALRGERVGKNLSINEIASVHGKAAERFLSEMEHAKEGGLKEALKYVEKEKALNWLGIAPPKGATQADGLNSIAKIVQEFENPKLSGGKTHISDKKMQPVSPKVWEKLIKQLQKSGLTRNVYTDKARMREYLEAYDSDLRKQSASWEENTEAVKNEDKALIKAAKNAFGTTNNFEEAGYLLQDGTMLDFSGKKNGARGGYRTMDHREMDYFEDSDGNAYEPGMVGFMAMGNIRLSPESGGFEITGLPTSAQNRTLRRYLRYFDGDVIVDFSVPGEYEVEHSVEYYEAKPERIINNIIDYYEKGIKPTTGLRLMSTPKGEVYGFVTPEGDIYLDPDRMNANTPIHEFGHLWNSFIKENNPELWRKGAELIKNSPYWEKMNNSPAYAHLSEDGKVDEALATAIGDKGEAMVQSGDILGTSRLRTWLNEVWDFIKETLFRMNLNNVDIENLSLDDLTALAVKEVTEGKEIKSTQDREGNSSDADREEQSGLENSNTNNSFAENNNVNHEIFDRSAQTQHGSRDEIHSRIEEVSNELRSGTGANDSELSRTEREDTEKRIAFDYAREKGLWIDDLYSLGKPMQGGGNENTLAYNAENGTIYKSNNLFNSKGLISNLLETVKIHNLLFPNTKYELVGFTGIINGANHTPYVEVILKQDYVPNAEQASPQEISDYMQSVGFRQVNEHTFTNGEYTVSDLRPRNVLKDKNGTIYIVDDIVSAEQSGDTKQTTGNVDLRFQVAPSSVNTSAQEFEYTGEERVRLEKRTERVWLRSGRWYIPTPRAFREGIQDAMLPVREWLDSQRRAGMKISDVDDFYMNYTSMSGKIDARMEHFRNAYAEPLTEAINTLMKNTGGDYRTVGLYAMLKHIPERNEQQQERAKKEFMENKPDATQAEIDAALKNLPDNGLKAIVREVQGMKADEKLSRKEAGRLAGEFIAAFEKKTGKEGVNTFWERVRKATGFSLDERYKAGMKNKEVTEEIRGMYKNYVPLRGHEADTAEDTYDYGRENTVFFNPVDKRAKGRSSISEDPFAHIYSIATSAIHESVNNHHLQQVKRLAARVEKAAREKGEKPPVTVSRTWFVKEGEKWKVADEVPYPDDENLTEEQKAEKYREAVEAEDKRLEELAEKGEAKRSGTKGLNLDGMFIKASNQRQHDVHVLVNGVMHTIRFHGNPSVARAINKANRVYADRSNNALSHAVKWISKGTRFLSAMYTTFRPAFALFTNPTRDFRMIGRNTFVREGAAYTGRALGHYFKALPFTAAYVMGHKNLNNKYSRYYSEYILNGGKTGISRLIELRDIQKEINSDLSLLQANWLNKNRRLAGRFLHTAFTALNEWTENNARFAVYVTSREMNRSVQRSVSDAKEVTVNFNRKGSGAYGGAEMRTMYAFANVGFQGAQQYIHNWKAHTGRMAAVTAADAALSAFLIPLLNSFIAKLRGGDDDDEVKWEDEFARLPDYVRNNNTSIWTGKGFIHIPLPQEFRAANIVGTGFFMMSIGKGDIQKMGEDMMLALLELIAYNPALDVVQGSLADAYPTALVPAMQVHENKTFTGGPIYNEWANPDRPLWKQVRTNKKGEVYAPKSLIDFLGFLDEVTGGDGVKPGGANFDPDKWNHVLNGYVGAVYKPLIQSIDVVRGDKAFKEMFVPKAMYTSADNLPLIDPYSNERYYDARGEVERSLTYYKDYAKDYLEASPDSDVTALDNYMETEHPEIWEKAKLSHYPKDIEKLESQLKGATADEQKGLEVEIAALKYEFLEKYNEALAGLGKKGKAKTPR
jgi:hypothetical protein